jgi:hypothetical protein
MYLPLIGVQEAGYSDTSRFVLEHMLVVGNQPFSNPRIDAQLKDKIAERRLTEKDVAEDVLKKV